MAHVQQRFLLVSASIFLFGNLWSGTTDLRAEEPSQWDRWRYKNTTPNKDVTLGGALWKIGHKGVTSALPPGISGMADGGIEVISDYWAATATLTADGLREIQRELDELARIEPENFKAIVELRTQIYVPMTMHEFRMRLFISLRDSNAKLAQMAAEINRIARTQHEQQDLLTRHERLIEGVHGTLDYLHGRQIQFETDVSRVMGKMRDDVDDNTDVNRQQNARLNRMEETYPRWEPVVQASLLGVDAMKQLLLGEKGDIDLTIRAFEMAHAIDPPEPAFLYGLAVALRRNGETLESELILSRAIIAERHRPLGKWYVRMSERFQGSDRFWLERFRMDPLLGVHVPGNLRIPATRERRETSSAGKS